MSGKVKCPECQNLWNSGELHDQTCPRCIQNSPQFRSLLLAAQTGFKWMSWWLEENECDCEGAHICGRSSREQELVQMQSAINEALDLCQSVDGEHEGLSNRAQTLFDVLSKQQFEKAIRDKSYVQITLPLRSP